MAPDPQHRESLVEPEGVNADSRRTEEQPRAQAAHAGPGDDRPGGHPERAGGHPERADEQDPGEQATAPEHDRMVGAPGTDERDPSQPQGEPGQDTGSQA